MPGAMHLRQYDALLVGQSLIHRKQHERSPNVLLSASRFEIGAQFGNDVFVGGGVVHDARETTFHFLDLTMEVNALGEPALEQAIKRRYLARCETELPLDGRNAPPSAIGIRRVLDRHCRRNHGEQGTYRGYQTRLHQPSPLLCSRKIDRDRAGRKRDILRERTAVHLV